MKTTDERLEQIETRLTRLERLIISLANEKDEPAPPLAAAPAPEMAAATIAQAAPIARPTTPPLRPRLVKREATPLPVTQILGWTGASALVLAAAYLIRLALDAGWLTPERQLTLAVLSAFSLIGAGLWLRSSDRQYASLLPAGGLVVLFLSIYGAHLYYHFIGAHAATAAVIVTCLVALWLGSLFESELYGLFAVVGSYSAPFMLHTLSGSVTDLVIYYSAWSALFCIYAIWIGQRRVYLLAAYMALLGFHFLWRQMSPSGWGIAFLFQAVQFMIFISGAVAFSVRHARPMDKAEALAHLPLLLIFYALQYALLQQHLPSTAPWIALGSAGVLLLAYLVARRVMSQAPESGALLVGAYAALALFHAGYMELIPGEFAPWVALLLAPLIAVYFMLRGKSAAVGLPIRLVIGVIFAINYLRVLLNTNIAPVPAHDLLALLYALELYAAYYYAGRLPSLKILAAPALFAGHIALMGAAVQILDGRLMVSLAWGAISIACLMLSFQRKDKLLGKSSLLIFAASSAKVLLFDLSSATPLVRIGSLVVLGITLYIGGWMYKKVDAMDTHVAG